jgi:nitrogen-specific signal transduction histidine kinase/CheY-like chemotaxis protein
LGLAGLVVLALILASYVSIRRSRNKVSAANAVLQSTNSELQHALRAKSDFLAMTSHEIRTPLNGIMGMTQVILANSGLDGKVREQMTLLSRSGKAMQTLVDDLLDTAKLETGEIKLTQAPVDIAAVVTEAVNLWREQANAKGLALNLRIDDMPRQVVTDGARVRQIILNLMSNAVKFTDAGEIAVRLTAGDGADRFVIAVTDSGIGIPADQQAKIFDEFHQVDSGTSRNHGGTGLGLAISSKLAKALGGDLSVESSEGAGSTFIISLPLVAVATTAKRSTPPQSLSDMRVGLVEANEMKRTIIQGLIQPRVAEVIGTGDHGGALMLLEQSNVDMMIIEAHSMAPEPEQQHLLTSFISAAKDQKTSTIVLLPKESHLSAETIANAGADRVLVKPIDGTSLIDALHSIQSEIAIYYKTVTIKAA